MKELIRKIIQEHLLNEMSKKFTTQDFIEKAQEVHGQEYDYSLVDYQRNNKKEPIICRKHGIFYQDFVHHVTRKQGCNKCYGTPKKTTQEFIKQAELAHPNKKYDYSLVNYSTNKDKVQIICPEKNHGVFFQTPIGHLNGEGCPKCAGKNRSNDDIIQQFRKIHGEKYDYSKVDFVNNKTDVIIICPIHKEFLLDPGHHLAGVGCRKCSGRGLTNSEWIERAKKVHPNSNYDYSNFVFSKAIEKTTVICPKHGPFYVRPNDHINSGIGCAKCKESKGEKYVANLLNILQIDFERQKKYDDCKGESKKFCKKLPYDFYLPVYNILIEYDGRQHFEPVYGQKQLEIQKSIDEIKNQYAKKNNIKLLRISYKLKPNEIDDFLKRNISI